MKGLFWPQFGSMSPDFKLMRIYHKRQYTKNFVNNFSDSSRNQTELLEKDCRVNFMSICRLVNETCTIMLMQVGMQANQFASAIDCAGNITNFTENCTGKSFLFSENSKETCPLIFVSVIRKVKSWIEQIILLLLFICKIRVILCCKVLKVFNFKLFPSF